MMWKPLSYDTYEEAIKNYKPEERWLVFNGNRERFNIAYECIDRHINRGVAIRLKFSDGKIESYTFNQISKLSSQFANLLGRYGIKKGDKISILLEPCLEFYASFFGSIKAGVAVVICSPLLGTEAVRYRLEDSRAKLVILEREQKYLVSSHVEHVVFRDEIMDLLKGEEDKFEYSTSVEDVAVIQYTSGTTGNPKPVIYRHKSLVSLVPAARFAYGIKEGDSFFCTSPIAWGHGIWGGTCAPLMFGITTGTRSGKFEPERILEALEEFKVNNITLSPTACRRLISVKDFKKYDLLIQKITYTGEHMDLDTFNEARTKFGVDPCSIYGSTEVGVIIANFAGFKNWKVKPGSLGKPMPGLEVAVIDENNRPLPPNVIGDIAVKLRGEWVKVGDSGLMDEDGYFWYKGRSDDVIKSSGYRIGPEEVEIVLNKHEAVLESAVIGIPDKERGQIVKAFIKLKSGYIPSDKLKENIQFYARKQLSTYAYPREIEFVDEIPKTMDGKIRRKELRLKELDKLKERGKIIDHG